MSLKVKNISSFIFFSILFYLNIGLKEVYRLFNTPDGIIILSIGLTAISITAIFLLNKRKINNVIFYSILFHLFLVFSSFLGESFTYGIHKSSLGILLPTILFAFFKTKEWEDEKILNFIVLNVLLISIYGILYKLQYGLFQRSVSFGLLGSITFGWVNGMALIALFLKEKIYFLDLLGIFFFLLMIFWTGSKGPLIGIVLIVIMFYKKFIGKSFSNKFLFSIILSLSIFIAVYFMSDIRSVRSIVNFFDNPNLFIEGQGSGSVGSRLDFISLSINSFIENPILGLGFGGWENEYFGYLGHKYPHNFFFELLSEVGVLGLLPFFFLMYKIRSLNRITIIGIFGVITLLFSGDMSYFRYAYFPLLIAYSLNKKK